MPDYLSMNIFVLKREKSSQLITVQQQLSLQVRVLFYFISSFFISVFNIAVNVCNGQSWKDAFMGIIPTRKGATELSTSEPENEILEPNQIE